MAEKTITAIDLGSSKVCTIIAVLHPNDKLEIKGLGIAPSKGIENGLVRDLQKTAESITQSVELAEKQANIEADNLYVAISGQHIKSKMASGKISIANGSQPSEIDENHIDSVINDAKNSLKTKAGSDKMEILHCIPQSFDIDTQKGISNPIGMAGFSLEVHTLLLLAEISHLRNIKKAFEMAEMDEPTIVVGSVATAEAVTNEDETRLGCIVLDIGEGTSDLTIYQNSTIKSYLCVPKGGALISDDLAVGLRTPPASAENLKIDFGNAIPSSVKPELVTDVEGIGGRETQRKSLTLIAQITQIRVKEILDTCYKEIFTEFTALHSLTAGIILTGGTAQIKNIEYLVEDENVFNLPCKIAYPDMKKLSGAVSRLDNPAFSTVIGLLYYITKYEKLNSQKSRFGNLSNVGKIFKNIINKIKDL